MDWSCQQGKYKATSQPFHYPFCQSIFNRYNTYTMSCCFHYQSRSDDSADAWLGSSSRGISMIHRVIRSCQKKHIRKEAWKRCNGWFGEENNKQGNRQTTRMRNKTNRSRFEGKAKKTRHTAAASGWLKGAIWLKEKKRNKDQYTSTENKKNGTARELTLLHKYLQMSHSPLWNHLHPHSSLLQLRG